MPEPLQVWLYDCHVADITGTRTGAVSCGYTREARDRWPLNLPVLSCSLPVRTGRERRAAPFFRGLLPEGDALRAMAAAARTTVMDTLGMLDRFGRDVAGAVVVSRRAPQERAGSVVPYDDETLAADVLSLADTPLALHEDSELSVAGLQDKLLLVRTADGWARPQHGFPSTHILKVEDRRFPGLVAQEAAVLRLAAAVDLTGITPEVVDVAGVPCLVVDRFDRAPAPAPGAAPLRLHQEDVCQAMGVDPDSARGHAKYEVAGGPRFRDVAALLDRHAALPVQQLERLLQVAVLTVAVGNADAHGKNLALLHTAPGVVELAPLYDTVPTALFGTLRREAAMSVNGRLALDLVTGADLVTEAASWSLSVRRARAVVEETADRLRHALAQADPTPELAALVQRRAAEILASMPR